PIMRGTVSSPHISKDRAILVYIRDTFEETHRYGGEKPWWGGIGPRSGVKAIGGTLWGVPYGFDSRQDPK
ncbi:MAG: hypothetical protein LBP93_02800, partial [Treponema sp.]|nr:hypothetical protein [Treponema sp.]